ncbi:MAG: hypothetical protein JXR69_00275 [Candidatus Delongbacteria bacterium]|nr:hypothetical protein [Candidatus Delongbacteria bacterium]
MKTFIKVLIILGILAIVFMLGINYFISRLIDREAVTFAVEENIDTRFDVQDISVNIFSTTPSIHLEDIKFAPRDEYADDQVAVKDRPEITSENLYLTEFEINIDIVHVIRSEGEIISEIIIGKGSSVNSSEILDELLSSIEKLSEYGIELEGLSDKLVLDDDLKVKTLFKDGKVSFLEDLKLAALGYDIVLTSKSWINLDSKENNLKGYVMLSEENSDQIFKQIDSIIDDKTSNISTHGYSVDKNKIKEKVLSGMVKDQRIVIFFESSGIISDPEVIVSSSFGSIEKIAEEAINDAIK